MRGVKCGRSVKIFYYVIISGYTIPKDTLIFSVLHYIMRDPDYWQEPEVFKPERFLNETGSEVIKEDRLIPFGVGKLLIVLLLTTWCYLFVNKHLLPKHVSGIPEQSCRHLCIPGLLHSAPNCVMLRSTYAIGYCRTSLNCL